jgi:hypothetical protein
LEEVFDEAFDKITSILEDSKHNKSLRELALTIAMRLLASKSDKSQEKWTPDEVKLFKKVIENALITSQIDNTDLIDRFQVSH